MDLEQVIGHAPTPEFALQVVEEADRLLGRLPDSGLQQVAIWKMEGYTNAEIAAKLGCATDGGSQVAANSSPVGTGNRSVTDIHHAQDDALPVNDELLLDRVCDEFEQAWKRGSPPRIEQYVNKQSLDTSRLLLVELIRLDLFYRIRVSQSVSVDDYVARFPELDTSLLRDLVEIAEADAKLAGDATSPSSSAPTDAVRVLELGPDVTIGPYRLMEHIGEGGMGSVFRALQTSPVKRQVALKVVKPGLESDQFVARFEAERQALALMDHPNIAKVFDAGTTDDGRPYFVMELVQGVSITSYCDENRLTLRQRLELFLAICRAVQHAHQKGIIHRDLKPSNVLVAVYDGKPMPKVIDFGVVKITGATLTERTTFTGWGTLVGTLQYMSPEQAELDQLDTDTRCDIYSLSVLLYELLTGTTPLGRDRLKDHGLLDVLRIIRDEDPLRPMRQDQDAGERGPRCGESAKRPNTAVQINAWRAGLDRHEGTRKAARAALPNGV